MGHLKRTKAPKFWPIKRKKAVFTAKPSPGPHPIERSIPLVILVRDVLKFADAGREANAIIKQGKILVDKKPRKDRNFPVGLMDLVEMPEAKKFMRAVMGTKGLRLEEIGESDSSKKICRIEGKTTVNRGLFQLNLHDGRNILTESRGYSTGDSILLELPGQNIIEHYKMAEGCPAIIIGGKNIGLQGAIEGMLKRKTLLEKNKVIIKANGGKIETLKKYIMVTGTSGTQLAGEELKPKKQRK